jgi:hypothetical protein
MLELIQKFLVLSERDFKMPQYKSEYYNESNVEQKDSITSGALTTGIICTVIVFLLTLLGCLNAMGIL